MRLNVVYCLGMTVAVAAGGASFQAAERPNPTFRAGTRLVEIDVVVRGKNGPVTSLTKDDFTVFDDGKLRKIDVFKAGPVETGAVAEPLPKGAVSNRVDSLGEPLPSATVVLIDQLNTNLDLKAYAARAGLELVRALGPRDRVAIYTLGKDLHVLQEFTDDPEKLVSAMMHSDMGHELVPQADLPEDASTAEQAFAALEAQINADYHNAITIEALRRVVRHLSGMPGRRNLVWLKETPSVPPPVMGMLLQADIALYPVLVRTVLFKTPDIMAVQRAGRALAAATGGASFDDARDLHLALETAQQDARNVYTLGYYPAEDDLDGKYHRISVKVAGGKSAHLDLHYRPGYVATTQALESTERPPVADAEQSAAPPIRDGAKRAYADLFTDPLDATAIGLAAVSTPDPQNPGKWQLHVRIDLHDIHLQRGGAQTSGVVEVALPIKGGINVRSFRIGLTDQQLASALSNGFSMMIPDVEVPGANLRLVVRDPATGLAGSVRIPLRN